MGVSRWLRALEVTAGPLLAAIAVAPLASCARSPAAEAKQATTTLSSWDATLDLLERQRARGAVPDRFAEQVRRAADEERRKAVAKLREAAAR